MDADRLTIEVAGHGSALVHPIGPGLPGLFYVCANVPGGMERNPFPFIEHRISASLRHPSKDTRSQIRKRPSFPNTKLRKPIIRISRQGRTIGLAIWLIVGGLAVLGTYSFLLQGRG